MPENKKRGVIEKFKLKRALYPTPSFGDVLSTLTVQRARPEARHHVLGRLLHCSTRLHPVGLARDLLVRARGQTPEVQARRVHHRQRPVVVLLRRQQLHKVLHCKDSKLLMFFIRIILVLILPSDTWLS